MLAIHILTLGRLKEIYWQEAEREYVKRLTPYARVTIHELKEESFDEKDSTELVKKKEAERISAVLHKIKDVFIVALDESGKKYNSKEFSEEIKKIQENYQTVLFIIGGPKGLDESILNAATLKLSLSSLTFTHQMARVFLFEQLYRSFMILNNRRYHY